MRCDICQDGHTQPQLSYLLNDSGATPMLQEMARLRATLPDGSPADRRGWPAALSSQDNPLDAMVRPISRLTVP